MFSFSSLNINLTNSTTSVYVMPDKALYWYGYNTGHSDYVFSASDSVTYNLNNITVSASYTTASKYEWAGISWDRTITANDTYLKATIDGLSSYGNPYMGSVNNRSTYIINGQGEYAQTSTSYTFTSTSIGKYPSVQRGGGYETIHAVWLE